MSCGGQLRSEFLRKARNGIEVKFFPGRKVDTAIHLSRATPTPLVGRVSERAHDLKQSIEISDLSVIKVLHIEYTFSTGEFFTNIDFSPGHKRGSSY